MKCSVDVSITFRDGRLTFVTGGCGPAYCLLTADVIPDLYDPDDFVIQAVYMDSDYTSARDLLEGQAEKDAKAILLANDDWREWAQFQVSTQRRAA